MYRLRMLLEGYSVRYTRVLLEVNSVTDIRMLVRGIL